MVSDSLLSVPTTCQQLRKKPRILLMNVSEISLASRGTSL